MKRYNGDFLNVEIFESSTDEPFSVEVKVQLHPIKHANPTCDQKKVKLQEKLAGYIKSHASQEKYQRPFYYHIDEADIRLFLFDKNDYSIDEFGKCSNSNRPKDESDNNFFGKLMEGLMFDSDLNVINIDFIEKYKMAQYYHEATSAGEKVFISRAFDDGKIEVALRESVAKMEEIERVGKLINSVFDLI